MYGRYGRFMEGLGDELMGWEVYGRYGRSMEGSGGERKV